jgi:hypothetical protein
MHRPQRSWVRVAGLVLVAILALASGRELVPGLCATKAALDSRNAADQCCQTPNSRDADGIPVVQADSQVFCAFCNLATTLVTATNYAELPTQAFAEFEPVVEPATFAIGRAIDTAHAGRAPPVNFAA